MILALEVIAVVSAVALGVLLTRILIRRNSAQAPIAGRWAGYGYELATNVLGLLLLGTVAAGSALSAHVISQAIAMLG
jgi:hypothetical protein